jgi:hypothetical protein
MEEKIKILEEVFHRIIYKLDNGIDSNFDEYKIVYDRINDGHNDSIDQIRKSFYQMAFCIEVRKTTIYSDIESTECNEWYEQFIILKK